MTDEQKFLTASQTIENPDINIIGIPFDDNSTGRRGSDSAPEAIRLASDLIETYSPFLKRDLEDLKLKDCGNIEIPDDFPLETIQNIARQYFQAEDRMAFLGGNHSVSIPLVKAARMIYPNLCVLILDAHCDLRDEYEGSRFSHACAARRIAEIVGWGSLKIFGARSGTKEEFNLLNEHNLRVASFEESLVEMTEFLTDMPVYISLDMDVFDPSLAPGVGTPEPGGISYFHFLDLCQRLVGINMVGFDIVELCPPVDPAGISAVTAASCARELMLLMG
ncbi:MAG: agmatinase [candidate division Zixibacteria bacterium]|nr:agmatinase [Candidatus Tariuqbacter arcticus]